MITAAAPSSAQSLTVWLDASASDARPPAGAIGESTLYSLVGARASAAFDLLSAEGWGRYGAAASGDEGRWLQGEGSVFAGSRLGPGALRIGATGFGLRYLDPFEYSGAGVGLQASFTAPAGPLVFTVAPRWSGGGWTADSLSGGLHLGGGSVSLLRSRGPAAVSATAEALSVSNGAVDGAFLRAAATLGYGAPRWSATARLEAQRNPLEDVLGGGVTVSASLSERLQVQLDLGRTVRDPLFGTPGSFSISLGVSIRALDAEAPPPAEIAHVGAGVDGGRRVEFTLPGHRESTVSMVGDFTGWRPVPMERKRNGWVLDFVLEPGLYHFGFEVDGAWYVPSSAPGLVEDGWGRKNASLVIEQ